MASRPQPIPTQSDPAAPCRVAIVDDSVVARLVIGRMLTEQGGFEIAGEASTAEKALALVSDAPCDIILLDIEMPGMGGLQAIPLLREKSDAAIFVLSSHCREGAEASMKAMTLGATHTLLKPGARDYAGAFRDQLIGTMRKIAAARGPVSGNPDAAEQRRPDATIERPVRCLAIGASTGGVHAMIELLKAIPAEQAMSILVTQHLPADFIEPFSRQMQLATGRPFTPARDGMKILAGQVLVAPGDAHLTIEADGSDVRARFRRNAASSGCMPSVDPMFESVARIFGADAVGVVLSGMGRDGAEGARSLAEVGGEILVQDQVSAVVWGMPGAAARQGIARFVAAPGRLGRHIARRAGANGWR